MYLGSLCGRAGLCQLESVQREEEGERAHLDEGELVDDGLAVEARDAAIVLDLLWRGDGCASWAVEVVLVGVVLLHDALREVESE